MKMIGAKPGLAMGGICRHHAVFHAVWRSKTHLIIQVFYGKRELCCTRPLVHLLAISIQQHMKDACPSPSLMAATDAYSRRGRCVEPCIHTACGHTGQHTRRHSRTPARHRRERSQQLGEVLEVVEGLAQAWGQATGTRASVTELTRHGP